MGQFYYKIVVQTGGVKYPAASSPQRQWRGSTAAQCARQRSCARSWIAVPVRARGGNGGGRRSRAGAVGAPGAPGAPPRGGASTAVAGPWRERRALPALPAIQALPALPARDCRARRSRDRRGRRGGQGGREPSCARTHSVRRTRPAGYIRYIVLNVVIVVISPLLLPRLHDEERRHLMNADEVGAPLHQFHRMPRVATSELQPIDRGGFADRVRLILTGDETRNQYV